MENSNFRAEKQLISATKTLGFFLMFLLLGVLLIAGSSGRVDRGVIAVFLGGVLGGVGANVIKAIGGSSGNINTGVVAGIVFGVIAGVAIGVIDGFISGFLAGVVAVLSLSGFSILATAITGQFLLASQLRQLEEKSEKA